MHKPCTAHCFSPNGSMKNTSITLMPKRWMCTVVTPLRPAIKMWHPVVLVSLCTLFPKYVSVGLCVYLSHRKRGEGRNSKCYWASDAMCWNKEKAHVHHMSRGVYLFSLEQQKNKWFMDFRPGLVILKICFSYNVYQNNGSYSSGWVKQLAHSDTFWCD